MSSPRVMRWLLIIGLYAKVLPGSDARVEILASPAAATSMTPYLGASASEMYLSWLERTGEGHSLRLARWDGERFSEPTTVRTAKNFFANWADFPSVLPLEDGRVAVHWLEKAGEGTYEYDVRFSLSRDRGRNWDRSRKLHRDRTLTEHGFASLASHGRDGLAAVWLDGRKGDEMSLYATSLVGNELGDEQLLDDRVCECCQTAMAVTDEGWFVAYRDRSAEEIRDIAYVRRVDGTWTEPKTLNPDGWKIDGCPVNGPQVTASGRRLAIAWFSAAEDEPRVQVVFSSDFGESFSAPVRLAASSPLGRVDIELVDD
ncbi:MAG TPA: exo-alpha-sialidase, partial [Vicinamibacteria bacterium]|nr:exo-alpha-sialidase [Vicinamibacteria bacterium]